jgi:very-short-patch-repair endonuclease
MMRRSPGSTPGTTVVPYTSLFRSAAESVPSVGLRVLKQYLEFAETGRLPIAGDTQGDAESPFEEAVCEFLTGAGCQVRKQVGSVGFRIDLAVVDPEHPGRYLLGIECDGAQYHSSKVARDRDRLRQQVLEGLGWRIHRVWSPDWFRNRKACEAQLIEAVERARIGSREPAPLTSSGEPAVRLEKVHADLVAQGGDDPFESIPRYRVCESCGLSPVEDFGTVSDEELVNAVGTIVAAEGPVHVAEVARRIRTACGIKRTGKKVQARIAACIEAAARHGEILLKGSFAWPREMPQNLVRRRDGLDAVKAESICDEEIAGAIAWILARQYGTEQGDLIAGTARLLGLRSVREGTSNRIGSVIDAMLRRGDLLLEENGTICLEKGS